MLASHIHARGVRALAGFTLVVALAPAVRAQSTGAPPDSTRDAQLAALIAQGIQSSPALRAAASRVRAASARTRVAGAFPDPMLMAGVQNVPVAAPALGAEDMTMTMVGVEQTIPGSGKLAARRAVARGETDAAAIALDTTRRAVRRDIMSAYYELAYLDHALEVARRNETVLAGIVDATAARYRTGSGSQADVLKARVAATQLGETATTLLQQRAATLAALNATLHRESDTPVERADFPARLARIAGVSDPATIRFAGTTLGAPVSGSPIPPLAALQAMAAEHNPMLLAHMAQMRVQRARVTVARKDYAPDFDVSLQYGRRIGRPDLVTAQVAIPLQLHRGSVQAQELAAARSEADALDAEHDAQVDQVNATVARLYADVTRQRTQLALYVRGIIPQGRATLASATAGYQTATVDLLTLLDDQATLLAYDTAYYRALADLGESLAQLEYVVGTEVVQ